MRLTLWRNQGEGFLSEEQTIGERVVGETTSLRGLIGKLLEKDLNQRIRLEEIKVHDFFKGIEWDLVVEIGLPPFIPESDHLEGGFQGHDIELFMLEVFKIDDGDNNNEK